MNSMELTRRPKTFQVVYRLNFVVSDVCFTTGGQKYNGFIGTVYTRI